MDAGLPVSEDACQEGSREKHVIRGRLSGTVRRDYPENVLILSVQSAYRIETENLVCSQVVAVEMMIPHPSVLSFI